MEGRVLDRKEEDCWIGMKGIGKIEATPFLE
jgi:hypothetical protein